MADAVPIGFKAVVSLHQGSVAVQLPLNLLKVMGFFSVQDKFSVT